MSHIIGICPLAIQQEAQDGMGGIYHIKPGAESLTLTLQDDILTLQNIADKLGIHPIVTLRKARTVGMTQSGYHHIGIILCSVCHAERFGSTFGRWIAGTHRCTIHIAAALLGKFRAIALAIDFTRRDINHALHAVTQSIFQQIGYAVDVCLHHLYRVLLKEVRTRIAGCIDDVISALSQLIIDWFHYHPVHALDDRLGNVYLCKEERFILPIGSKLLSGTFLVSSGCYHLVAPGRILHQHINHTASYQSCSTSHKNGFAMQTPQFQTFPEKARNIFLIW